MTFKELLKEEDRRIRRLRLLVDITTAELIQSRLSIDEALSLIEKAKAAALILFPGKEHVFDLVCMPRFERIIRERFPCRSISFSSN